MGKSVFTSRFVLGLAFVIASLGSAEESTSAPSEPIVLLPHQQLPIDYLVQHPEIKGLLINHFIGTGKTYLALGAAERFADLRVLILAPRFLRANWEKEMTRFGVKDKSRYDFVSYEEAGDKLINRDLSHTFLILDEGHNLVRFFKSSDVNRNRIYSDLYVRLRGAQKILVLTGTPIYNNEHDLAYILNLVSGHDFFSFNEQQFLTDNTKIIRGRSFWRGYVAESMILQAAFPTFIGFIAAAAFATFIAFPVASGIASVIIPLTTWTLAPVEKYNLRELDPDKFISVAQKYVSYHEIENLDMSEFPTKNISIKDVNYSREQFRFFLNFIDGTLDDDQLLRILKENKIDYSSVYIHLNSSLLQNNLRFTTGTGREIGNLAFTTPTGEIDEPPKFLEILKTMQQSGMPKTVLYSSYFENGILSFADFLQRHGLGDQFRILHPDLSVAEQTQMVDDYNAGKFKILLLHPDITEGISLKETRQFHLLEPVLNRTLFEQVIGRAVRFQSHSALPMSERVVDVFVWKATISDWDLETMVEKYENWREKYSEMSNWSGWGRNISQVDKNHDRKLMSPDDSAIVKLDALASNIGALREMFKKNSIESNFVSKSNLSTK